MKKTIQIHEHPQGHWMLIDKLNYQIGDNFNTFDEALLHAKKVGYTVEETDTVDIYFLEENE